MEKVCLKCGHTTTEKTLQECPSCGAIYAKVEAASARGAIINRVTKTKSPPASEHIENFDSFYATLMFIFFLVIWIVLLSVIF